MELYGIIRNYNLYLQGNICKYMESFGIIWNDTKWNSLNNKLVCNSCRNWRPETWFPGRYVLQHRIILCGIVQIVFRYFEAHSATLLPSRTGAQFKKSQQVLQIANATEIWPEYRCICLSLFDIVAAYDLGILLIGLWSKKKGDVKSHGNGSDDIH